MWDVWQLRTTSMASVCQTAPLKVSLVFFGTPKSIECLSGLRVLRLHRVLGTRLANEQTWKKSRPFFLKFLRSTEDLIRQTDFTLFASLIATTIAGWGRDTLEAGKGMSPWEKPGESLSFPTFLRRWRWLQVSLSCGRCVFFWKPTKCFFLPEFVGVFMYPYTQIGDSFPLLHLYNDVIPVHWTWIFVWKAHYALMIMGEIDWFPQDWQIGLFTNSPSICLMLCHRLTLSPLYIKIGAGRV